MTHIYVLQIDNKITYVLCHSKRPVESAILYGNSLAFLLFVVLGVADFHQESSYVETCAVKFSDNIITDVTATESG